MSTRRSKWISGIGAMLVSSVLTTSVVAADDGMNPFNKILSKLDQVLHAIAAIGSGGGPVDRCNGGSFVGRFVPIGTTEVCDRTTGLTWQKTPDAASAALTNVQAVTYCLSKGNNYRLPEIKELISLVDYSQFSPALPVGVFTGVATDPDVYWSATARAGAPALDAWDVHFAEGHVVFNNKESTFHVWCVRGA